MGVAFHLLFFAGVVAPDEVDRDQREDSDDAEHNGDHRGYRHPIQRGVGITAQSDIAIHLCFLLFGIEDEPVVAIEARAQNPRRLFPRQQLENREIVGVVLPVRSLEYTIV